MGNVAGEIVDVVIIGAGAAGLIAAHRLSEAGAKIALLEQGNTFGGRVRSGKLGEHYYNSGAQFLLYEDPITRRLIDDQSAAYAEYPSSPWVGYFKKRLIVAKTQRMFGAKLPLSIAAKLQIFLFDRKMKRLKKKLPPNPLSLEFGPDQTFVEMLDNTSMLKLLGKRVLPDVKRFYETVMGPLESATALKGLLQSSAETPDDATGSSSTGYVVMASGNASVLEALGRKLDRSGRLNCSVHSLTQGPDAVEIKYSEQGREQIIRARYAIVATPANVSRTLIEGLPPEHRAALEKIVYKPLYSCVVLTDETEPSSWDRIPWSMLLDGLCFHGLTHQTLTTRLSEVSRSKGSLLCAFGSDTWGSASDAEIEGAVIGDLIKLFPDLGKHVVRTVVTRWPTGLPDLGFGTLKTAATLALPIGRIRLAGDYIVPGGMGGTHSAFASGERAAEQVIDELRRGAN